MNQKLKQDFLSLFVTNMRCVSLDKEPSQSSPWKSILNGSTKIYPIEPRRKSRSSIISFEEDTHETIQISLKAPTHNHDQSMKVSSYILELRSNVQPLLNELDHPQINHKKPNLS